MSPMSASTRMISARRTLLRVSSSTAASLRFMPMGESSGRSSQLRSIRPPMGVLVWLSTPKRQKRRSAERMGSVRSRLRLVE